MKKILFFAAFLISFVNVNSQIGIGTNNPAVSSLLDISSTTKGLLMPRMTSVQRGAIVSPATGLLVFDTDTKTLWTFDSSAWKNLYTSGGGLILPYSQTVNTGISAFQVTNQGLGAAIEGSSSNEYGMGIYTKATGAYGWGLNAFSGRPGATSIRSMSDSGIAFHGENVYAGNTNNLMYLLNRGMGKTLHLQLANTTNSSANLQIAGNNLGRQVDIFQTNVLNSSPAVAVTNSGTGIGVYAITNNGIGVTGSSSSGTGVWGTSSTGYGVKGESNTSTGFGGVRGDNNGSAGSGVIGVSNAVNTQGVYGTSTNGIGVRAISNTYRAVQAVSTSGTGVYATSTSGLALEIAGNVKISGGNTNPSNGAVLTSDASGNATWQPKPKVAFKVNGSSTNIPEIQFVQCDWNNEVYDLSSNFNMTTNKFVVPISGVYSFSAAAKFQINSNVDNFSFARIQINVNRNGNISALADIHGPIDVKPTYCSSHCIASTDANLQQGDEVYVTVYQQNPGSHVATISCSSCVESNYFSGHLVVAN